METPYCSEFKYICIQQAQKKTNSDPPMPLTHVRGWLRFLAFESPHDPRVAYPRPSSTLWGDSGKRRERRSSHRCHIISVLSFLSTFFEIPAEEFRTNFGVAQTGVPWRFNGGDSAHYAQVVHCKHVAACGGVAPAANQARVEYGEVVRASCQGKEPFTPARNISR